MVLEITFFESPSLILALAPPVTRIPFQTVLSVFISRTISHLLVTSLKLLQSLLYQLEYLTPLLLQLNECMFQQTPLQFKHNSSSFCRSNLANLLCKKYLTSLFLQTSFAFFGSLWAEYPIVLELFIGNQGSNMNSSNRRLEKKS